MPWDPEVYNRYKDIRYKPFYDLLNLVEDLGAMECIDLGCGTGEQTATLANRFKEAKILGVDNSAEMLEKSKPYENDRLKFKLENIEDAIVDNRHWDLIFSNAALQWLDKHTVLFPKVISKLKAGGQLAIQMPVQNDNKLNQILLKLVQEEPFASQLGHFTRNSPVLSMDEYTQILFDNGIKDIEIYQKVYPQIAENVDDLYDFISGSAMVPYLEILDVENKEGFIQEFKKRIVDAYKSFPAIYAFKRLLIYGRKG
ncbi:methyltransferase domain-containing protein [Sphingobacterium sp.]|uniref:methyltransferase domain-containing protein n=1 Tax=Sphingobacterium sp. TaxID=341027 RepID=UPI0028AF3E7C|nr:methyltransferase domain-containing protein [Sphingobacterium sp.]